MVTNKRLLNWNYFIGFIVCLGIEVFIALYIHDAVIRPYVGDILVIVTLYTLIRAIIQKPIRYLPQSLGAFAVCVEVMQLLRLPKWLGIQRGSFLSVVLGSTFDWKDIGCYFAGAMLCMAWEYLCHTPLK